MTDRNCANCKHHTEDGCSSWDCEYEPTDYISRADAIEAVKETKPIVRSTERNWGKMIAEQHSKELVKALKALPSADAVQGEWIVREYCTNELDYRRWTEIECPFCGEKPTYEDLDNMNYCPNCGARMKGGAE